jgi:hypothetical protein
MSLREMLGADVDRVHEQVDAMLDSEDAMIVLVDGSRAISYAQGFGTSPDQLELLALEIERAVRSVAGPPTNYRRDRRNYGEERENSNDSGRGASVRRDLDRFGRGGNGSLVDRGSESVGTSGSTHGNRGRTAGRVLRLAREAVTADVG